MLPWCTVCAHHYLSHQHHWLPPSCCSTWEDASILVVADRTASIADSRLSVRVNECVPVLHRLFFENGGGAFCVVESSSAQQGGVSAVNAAMCGYYQLRYGVTMGNYCVAVSACMSSNTTDDFFGASC